MRRIWLADSAKRLFGINGLKIHLAFEKFQLPGNKGKAKSGLCAPDAAGVMGGTCWAVRIQDFILCLSLGPGHLLQVVWFVLLGFYSPTLPWEVVQCHRKMCVFQVGSKVLEGPGTMLPRHLLCSRSQKQHRAKIALI